jgi:hypothetical protein
MYSENWKSNVVEAFERFCYLKRYQLSERVKRVYFTVGTWSSSIDKADTVRKRINTRMRQPVWGRISLNN